MEENSIKINLLSDEAVSEDFIGSHDKVALALCDVICKSEGARAIALQGKWGSGKSSIIKMLKTKLK